MQFQSIEYKAETVSCLINFWKNNYIRKFVQHLLYSKSRSVYVPIVAKINSSFVNVASHIAANDNQWHELGIKLVSKKS